MKTLNPISSSRQIGFSLVELMVAITISLILLAGVVQVYLSSKQTYRVQEALARVQENGRFAMDFLARDIRMAGYAGCAKRMGETNEGDITVTVDQVAPLLTADMTGVQAQNFINNAIQGFANVTAGTAPTGNGVTPNVPSKLVGGTDVIRITQASTVSANVISMATPTADIVVGAGVNVGIGDIAAISDCREAALFVVTNVTNNADGTRTIGHNLTITNADGTTSPANSTTDIGRTYDAPAQFVVFSNHTYSIANFSGKPGLYRGIQRRILPDPPVELIEGVQDMDIMYGVDTDALGTAGSGTADRYVAAGAIGTGRIVSVRVSLLLQTTDANVALGPQTFRFPADAVDLMTEDDGLLRRVFTSTIALRNRAP